MLGGTAKLISLEFCCGLTLPLSLKHRYDTRHQEFVSWRMVLRLGMWMMPHYVASAGFDIKLSQSGRVHCYMQAIFNFNSAKQKGRENIKLSFG